MLGDSTPQDSSPQPQPEYVWAFPPERQRHPGRVWLIVLLSILAIAIVGAVLWFTVFAAPQSRPTPTPSATSASPSATPTSTPTATPTATPAATPEPSPTPGASEVPAPTPEEPITEPPAPADPEIPVFREQVQPRLGEAGTGLDILSTTSGPDASMIVADLRADALRLVETPAPSSISSAWQGSVDGYLGALDALDSAISTGGDLSAAINNARGEIAILGDLLQ